MPHACEAERVGLQGRQIICFSSMDWQDNPTSKYHLMRLLSRRNDVWYVETLGTRAPGLADIPRVLRRVSRWMQGAQCQPVDAGSGGTLRTYAPLVIPYHELWGVRRVNRYLLRRALRPILQANQSGQAPIIWTYTPRMVDILDLVPESPVVYHCVDEWSTYPGGETSAFQRLEATLLRRADYVFVPNEELFKRKWPKAKVHLIPHGVEIEHFSPRSDDQAVEPPEMALLPHPRVILVGTIASWVDVDLLNALSDVLPKASFVFIGYVHSKADQRRFQRLRRRPNIHWLGWRPYAQLPRYYQASDVCLAPFIPNEHLRYASPTKLIEYLATGRPVVSTDVPGARVLSPWVRSGATATEIAAQIQAAVREDTAEGRAARRQAVASHSWEARLKEMERHIKRYDTVAVGHGEMPDQDAPSGHSQSGVCYVG